MISFSDRYHVLHDRYSTDFGKNEMEVLKHAANYLAPAESEQLLELLASTQLKVMYQNYDWSINI